VEDDTEDSWEGYETGPFCRHFGDPADCDRPCERCGHACREHGAGVDDEYPCSHDGCDCAGWVGEA
jgi:hypothetical protein